MQMGHVWRGNTGNGRGSGTGGLRELVECHGEIHVVGDRRGANLTEAVLAE
jgi:hypothetical protein